MRVTSTYTDSRRQALLILGDGSRDRLVLLHAFSKLDGERFELVHPEPPIGPKRTGLSALEALAIAVDKLKVEASVFVIDREHVEGPEEVERALKAYGFEVRGLRPIGDRAFKLDLTRGDKAVKLYVAIAGRTKCMEEDLEELANMYGVACHRAHEVKELFRRASRKDVAKAFDYLAAIVEDIRGS